MHAIPTKWKQLPRWHLHLISHNTIFINKKPCVLTCSCVYFHRTMEEFTLTRSYVKWKKYKEPSEKHVSDVALLSKSITIWSWEAAWIHTITLLCKLNIYRCCCVMKRHNERQCKKALTFCMQTIELHAAMWQPLTSIFNVNYMFTKMYRINKTIISINFYLVFQEIIFRF